MINHSAIVQQEATDSQIHTRPIKSLPNTFNQNDLKNIIELTEENDQNSNFKLQNNLEDPIQTQVSLFTCLHRLFQSCFGIWNYIRSSKPKWKYEIDQKDFEYYVNKIKNSKQIIQPMIPPQKQKRKVLVLDLDETLIYSTFKKPQKYDFQSQIQIKGRNRKIYTSKRFGLQSFLFEMSKIYQLIIFTASEKDYADKIINIIDPKKRISHRLYRQHCVVINTTNFLKNIKVLGRNIEDIIIVDDSFLGGVLQQDHYYKIQSFKGNCKDRQLLRAGDFLKYLNQQKKIVPIQLYRRQFQQMEIQLQETKGISGKKHNLRRQQFQRPRNTLFL